MPSFKVALVDLASLPAGYPPDWVVKSLAAEGISFRAAPCETRADLKANASDCDLVWVWGSRVLTSDRLDILSRCGAILRSGTGTDNVPVADATRLNILVANTPEAAAQEVSDHAIGLLLATARRIVAQDRLMRSGVWDCQRDKNRWHLRGSTLGLIGFGHIGRLVASKMKAFGLNVIGVDPLVSPDHMRSFGVEPVDFRFLLHESDFVSIHCPLNEQTRHLVSAREIEMMRTHAILINTSRGPIIDESALISALRDKRIGGAGLDVFEQEPLAPESPLFQLDNVVLTPHIAGYSDIFEQSFWRYSVESIVAIAKGYWPRSVVNPKVSPRWPLARRDWPAEPQLLFAIQSN